MTAPCTPFFNRSGGFGITGSPSAGWTFTKTAQASTAEVIATWKVSDDATAKITFNNADTTDAAFIPRITGTGSSSRTAIQIQADGTTDSGSNPVMIFNARCGSSAVSTRPIYSWANNASAVLQLLPLNSGANSALSWGTQADAVPAFTTRSAGTRLVLYNAIGAAAVDNAIGTSSSGAYQVYSIPQATSSYRFTWYAGTTNIALLRGDGQLTTTGSKVDKLRVALTTPVTVVAGTDYIVVSNLTTPGAVAVNLPATPATGLTYVIKDGKGDAAANNITITPAAGNIDGAGTLVLATNYARAVLVYNGTEWNVIT